MGGETQQLARALRVKLEALEDLRRSRSQLVHRSQRLSEADYIKSLILQKASGFEKFTEVQPAMFADITEAEMAKYDRFIADIEETGRRESKILEDITVRRVFLKSLWLRSQLHYIKHQNKLFLQSRRDDPTLKDREHALQTMDLAYHKYREITRNLDEGVKVSYALV
jgi:programmed cell death 6-interacting protein